MTARRMSCLAAAMAAMLLSAAVAPAQLISRPHLSRYSPTPLASSSANVGGIPLDSIAAPFQADVSAVVKKPTLSTTYTEPAFTANPKVYDWLLDHPDRAALGWERLGVSCLPIRERTNGTYGFQDDAGTDVSWQKVGTIADGGRVWLATGKVKPGPLMPTVPVKAVAVVKQTTKPAADGNITISPTVTLHFQTDSKAATAVMRMFGPAAPRMAEEGAEQLLFFFSGLAQYLHRNPDQTAALLSPPRQVPKGLDKK